LIQKENFSGPSKQSKGVKTRRRRHRLVRRSPWKSLGCHRKNVTPVRQSSSGKSMERKGSFTVILFVERQRKRSRLRAPRRGVQDFHIGRKCINKTEWGDDRQRWDRRVNLNKELKPTKKKNYTRAKGTIQKITWG